VGIQSRVERPQFLKQRHKGVRKHNQVARGQAGPENRQHKIKILGANFCQRRNIILGQFSGLAKELQNLAQNVKADLADAAR